MVWPASGCNPYHIETYSKVPVLGKSGDSITHVALSGQHTFHSTGNFLLLPWRHGVFTLLESLPRFDFHRNECRAFARQQVYFALRVAVAGGEDAVAFKA